MAGPPSYGSADQWSDVRELEWARESVAWTQRIIGPDSLIVTAALHRDEKSPHVQMLVVPVHEGRLGWTAVKNVAAARIAPGLPHPPRTKYAGFQDDYQAHVGRRFGLARGEVGSQATHAQIDRAEAARAELAKARKTWQRGLEEADHRVEQAAKRERKAVEAVDAAEARRLDEAEQDARIDSLLAEVADEKAAQAAERERSAVEAAKAAELRETLAGARVAFERDRASMFAAAARVVGEQITEQASELVVLRRETDKLTPRLVKARTARAEVDEHVQVKRRELAELDEKARVAFDAERTAAPEHDRFAREAGETEAARDRARRERDEAERDAGRARDFDAAGFAGLVLRVADRLRVVLPERLADALGRVVERRSAAPVF